MTTLFVSDYTVTPGPRFQEDGPFSGQEFLRRLLAPAFAAATQQGEQLLVDLDGTAGYGSSFLEEAFGGLAREYGRDTVEKWLLVKTDDEPYLEKEIRRYIAEVSS